VKQICYLFVSNVDAVVIMHLFAFKATFSESLRFLTRILQTKIFWLRNKHLILLRNLK